MRTSWIVEQQSKIIGYGNLLLHSEYPTFRKNNIPEISDLWVFEGYRKQGVGSLLIGHLELVAQERKYTQVGLGVGLYRDYGSAQKLYFQLGYRPDGEGITYKYVPVIPGEKYPVDDDLILWLVKELVLSGLSRS